MAPRTRDPQQTPYTGLLDDNPHNPISWVGRTTGGFRWAWHTLAKRHEALYCPLSVERKEFRLLKVYPGLPKHQLCAYMFVTSLDNGKLPRYKTISYCWGESTEDSILWVNGQRAAFRLSAMRAIHRMRLPNRPMLLWIDGICIDQGNQRERETQILLMKEIYSRSIGNMIYLGGEDDTTRLALQTFQ